MNTSVYFLLLIVGLQFGSSLQQKHLKKLRDRLSDVELQISRETFKTRSDIAELRDIIERINITGVATGRESSGSTDVSDIEAAMVVLESEMKEISSRQSVTITRIAKALSAEKQLTRQLKKELKQLQDNIVIETIDKIRDELKATMDVNNRLIQEVGEVKQENRELRGMIVDMQESLEKLGDASVTIPVNQPPCPDGWTKFQDMCYLYVKNEKISWHGAELRCDDHGGALAQPDTEDKMRYVLQSVERNVWLGASDDQTEGRWLWTSSQTPVQFFMWESGQPNSWRGNQDCMEKGSKLLNDENCMEENKYICQKKANV